MKRISLLFAVLLTLALFTLSGCIRREKTAADLTIEALESVFDGHFDLNTMHSADSEYIEHTLNLTPESYISGVMKVPTGTNQDEYGAFIAQPGNEGSVSAALTTYLGNRRGSWMDEYLPEEKHKLWDAIVITDGKYAYYVIADTETREAVKDAIHKRLYE
ncbi:MAG: DUF4358 domain-containing protein [Oscillospiraceae bacterium]|jgi:hypothetical protein|nr:DUF4358 domain-containing protein [Oscillospiraceae bacterium]